MSPVTHQTVKLSKGKHSAPEDGACAMELASMLAHEPFSDHPHSVCPAIGSFLRAYNDSIDDQRRQDLYAYAAMVVGSRASIDVEHMRAERLMAWAAERRPLQLTRVLPPRLRALTAQRTPPSDAAGARAVHAIRRHTKETHRAALALLDELLAIGAKPTMTLPAERNRSPRTLSGAA